MKWSDLDTFIPYLPEDGPAGHTALLSEQLMIAEGSGWAIRVSYPGKYWRETTPRGGDFVIEVTSSSAVSGSWEWHKFMHEAIFDDIQAKTNSKNGFMRGVFGPPLRRLSAKARIPTRSSPVILRSPYLVSTDLPFSWPRSVLPYANIGASHTRSRLAGDVSR